MDIEFHYYITFILSRKAGFKEDEAYKIAYSSQYTDDNKNHYYVNYENGGHFLNEISQTMDITKPSVKRQKIYPLFHFIPGGREAEETCVLECDEKKCFVTVPDSDNAKTLLKAALNSGDLYRMGIGIHAFADTWCHQNFLGLEHNTNSRFKGGVGIMPNIGHADFFHEPDKIHNEWADTRLGKRKVIISNDERLLEAAKQTFIHLYNYKNPASDDFTAGAKYEELKLEQKLKDAMDDSYWFASDDKARIDAYKKICGELRLKKYRYDPKKWRYAAVNKRDFEADLFDRYWAKEPFETDWYKFQKAVEAHRDYALENFQPLFDAAGLEC